jgi:hypothetical protein
MKKQATKRISSYDWREFEDKELKRLIKFYYSLGNNMETEDLTKVNDVTICYNIYIYIYK